jgi:hypothetical protein
VAEERSDVEEHLGDVPGTLETGTDEESTERIKRDIEQTRGEMGETIDEIQERLTFANLSDQVTEQVNNVVDTAKTALYDATVGKAVNYMKDITSGRSGGAVIGTVKNNPVPFVLIGAGAGLLALRTYRGNGSNGSSQRSSGNMRALSSGTENPSMGENSGASTLGKVTGAVSDTVGSAYEKVGELGGTAMETYDRQIQDNPLIVGAVAMAVGAAIGFAIPSTRYEGELMGDARNQLVDKAQTVASDLAEQAQSVATQVVDKAKDTVNEAVNSANA